MRVCRYCNDAKSANEFHTKFKCLECKNKQQKEWRERNKDYEKKRYQRDKKKILARNQKWRQNNREKVKKYYNRYYKENKDSIQSRTIKWGMENRDKTRKYNQKFYFANKGRVRVWQAIYSNNRRRLDPSFKLRKSVSRTIGGYLRQAGACKSGSVMCYLPYSIDDLKIHIESKFERWMNWNNWGVYNPITWEDDDPSTWTWQLDHIIPQSKLLYDSMDHSNFKKCWALSNLRPFSAKQNILDGNRR